MKRARSRSRVEKDAALLTKIQAIKADHPLWGYRRVWACLRDRNGLVCGKNTIYLLVELTIFLRQSPPHTESNRFTF